jgi:hypothetical protein
MSRDVDVLFEMLQEACGKQFGFASERISDNLQYMGPLHDGQHRFRDTLSHAEIHLTLNPLSAALFERPGQPELDWSESLLTEYRKSDDQLQVEHDARLANIRLTLESPLWATHGAYIRSLFPEQPNQVTGTEPFIGAYNLVGELLGQADPEFVAFSKRMGTPDVQELTFYLIDVYKLEIEDQIWAAIKENPKLKAIVKVTDEVLLGVSSADKEAKRLAREIEEALPSHLQGEGVASQIIILTMRNRSMIASSEPEPPSPAP